MRNRAYGQFLKRVHRRRFIIFALENIGVCAAVGSALVLPLILIRSYRDEPTFLPLACGGIVIAIAAIAITLRHRFNFISTAVEADRQLKLDDLLATAIQLDDGRESSDAMRDSVLMIADAQCEMLSPSIVRFTRFGMRGWGGVVLVMSAVVAVCMWPTHALRSAAADENGAELLDRHVSPSVSRGGVSAMEQAQKGETAERNSNSGALNWAGDSGRQSNGDDEAHQMPNRSRQGESTISRPSSMGGDISGGGGSTQLKHGDQSEVSGLASPSNHEHIKPWQAGDAVGASDKAVDHLDDQAPAADRDLVREFFKRD